MLVLLVFLTTSMDLINNSLFGYSMWSGYLSSKFDKHGQYKDLINDKNVIFEKLHTGGHSEQKDLLDFIANIAPKKFVPFHTNAPEKLLENYPNAIVGREEINI